jgi:transposase
VPYSSDLTKIDLLQKSNFDMQNQYFQPLFWHLCKRSNEEWEIFEPLLLQILPTKKQTRPSNWTKRELFNGILYQLKNGCNWQDLPKDLPPYSTVYWHYKQWRTAGVFEQLMSVLHGQVREQVKKNRSGRR